MRKRRYFRSEFERYEVKRKNVLRKYRDKEYIPPEQTVIDLLSFFIPLMEDNLEEEAWSICYGDNKDEQAKEIVQNMKSDIKTFLFRYRRQLNKAIDEDVLLKCRNSLKDIDAEQLADMLKITGKSTISEDL